MPLATLSRLAAHAPLRVLVVHDGDTATLDCAGILHPLRLAAKCLGPERLTIDAQLLEAAVSASELQAQLILLVTAEDSAIANVSSMQAALSLCGSAQVWGAVGGAVHRAAGLADDVFAAHDLYSLESVPLTCRGGAASIDFALSLIEAIYGAALQSEIMEMLQVQQVRAGASNQAERFGALQPKLAEALQLMESHIEEPLATDDIANLVGISRRQLERLFKQFLGNVPSRYYLELRLRRGRQMLLESHHSIVQVGLMCGFSSGSHFSTAYGALYGLTPREERQRKLSSLSESAHDHTARL
ncbi:MAG: helix-turn-helix domain-containing protein [Burkholderiaceae bacterium]|nr:helix-turn-helix domain-containing protein [Burkholderiaceae bacterium]